MLDDTYDIIIVGGGPAGTSAAYAAASAGARAVVLEKEPQIAQSVRTSGVTWMDTVREYDIPRSCYNPVKRYTFCSPNNEVTVTGADAGAAVLDVRATYRWLGRLAQGAGADILTGHSVTDITRDGQRIAGVTAKGPEGIVSLGGRVIIDASGFGSVVARSAGLAEQWSRFGAGAEYEARAENVEADRWYLMVGQEYSPAGYAWIFPTGGDTVRIGVGIGKPESDTDPTERLKKLLRDRPGPIARLGRIEPFEFHYGLIPNEGLTRKTVHNGLIMVGDSAGQANPLVLEGIRYAIRFGRLAGGVAADAVRSGDYSAAALEPYENTWRSAVESKINAAGKVQSKWIGLTDDQWDRELDIIRELNPDEFLDFVRADFGRAGIVRLAAHHPKLAVRQLFGMVGGIVRRGRS